MASGRRSWFLAACGQSYCHIELSLELFECFHELTAGFSQRVILDRVRWKLQCLKWPLLWSPQNSICTKVSHDWAYTHTHTHTHTHSQFQWERTAQVHDCQDMGPIGAILETGYNSFNLSILICCCSVTQLCLTLHNPMYCSMPGFPVLYYLPEFAQTHIHWVGDAIQPSHSLSSPFPPVLNLSQHQGFFQWVGPSHQVAKVVDFWLRHQSFQWMFRVDFL